MDAKEEQDGGEADAIRECEPTELAGTVGTIFEGLDERCHRVEEHDTMERRIGDLAERIDDRRSVHPEGDEDTEEIGQVTVFGRQGRDDESESERQDLNGHQHHREEQQIPRRLQAHPFDHKEDIDADESKELQREAEEFRYDLRDRRNESREIDFSEQAGVRLERTGDIRETGGEILPEADTAEVKDRLRNIIGGDAGDTAEDDHIHEHREERRDEIPAHTEDGLLILHGDVALDKQPDEIFLIP